MRITIVLCFFVLASAQAADNQVFVSESRQVPLIELFTSEGCSSCPPAERWLNSLSDNDGLWTEFVPVAFHVDYWDYIGWKDRFAKPEYSARQRNYIRQGAARAVYTPGVFSNGEEWLSWRRLERPSVNDNKPGALTVSVDGDRVAVFFENSTAASDLQAFVSLLGSGLSTEVRAGENKGKQLKHDFVVLGVNTTSMVRTEAGYKAILDLPSSDLAEGNRAIAAWVSTSTHLAPLQATGGPLQ